MKKLVAKNLTKKEKEELSKQFPKLPGERKKKNG